MLLMPMPMAMAIAIVAENTSSHIRSYIVCSIPYKSVRVRVCVLSLWSTPDIVARIEIVLHYRQINWVNCECSMGVRVCAWVFLSFLLPPPLVGMWRNRIYRTGNFALIIYCYYQTIEEYLGLPHRCARPARPLKKLIVSVGCDIFQFIYKYKKITLRNDRNDLSR